MDFESRLPSADFVAIDTELTGVDLEVTCGGGGGCKPSMKQHK